MKARKITADNFRDDKKKNTNTLNVSAKAYNDLVDDVLPVTNQLFNGLINLSRSMTHYAPLSLTSNMSISVMTTPEPTIGGYAEASLVGDGSHSPTFAAGLTITPGSDEYDTTLGVLNKVAFYYDGEYTFYTITAFAS